MSHIISVASGFQYSVNIGYDLNDEQKLKHFIPTNAALTLLEEILLSTYPNATDRARVLIGAYGKGKSHIVLMILTMLLKRELRLYEKLMPKIAENPRLLQAVNRYYESDNKILPIVVTGSSTSIPQAFLMALQRTLSENNLLDIMPETNYQAAVAVLQRWKEEFPTTYHRFEELIDGSAEEFQQGLRDYNVKKYEVFEKAYPLLTSGSVFNPFVGFEVAELYERAAKGLKKHGYSGIYIVYDEFSKFLEANISQASVSDTKTLQDLAEKCNRSGSLQMHLMLISHKELSNYIDGKLPKEKTDGWRGVSERFKHIHLNNDFTQTYDMISCVIEKNAGWNAFCTQFEEHFGELKKRYQVHPLFQECNDQELDTLLYQCYPLHPVSTFILPRLSERVAQNERTLFTFLSTSGAGTLPEFLTQHDDTHYLLMTPDQIYDYFELLFRKEVYEGAIHQTYLLTSRILADLQENKLERKLIKSISLIYMLEQFEKLKPTKEELVGIYSNRYTVEEISEAIESLISQKYLVYLKRSNGYLQLKQSSGVDIRQKVHDTVEAQKKKLSVKDTLNAFNLDNYLYPSRYNDEREMTRYFSVELIDESEITESVRWSIKGENNHADGVIYGVLVHSEQSLATLEAILLNTSTQCHEAIFILPKEYQDIEAVVWEYNAVLKLREEATGDSVLWEEYQMIYEDLREVLVKFLAVYIRPEGGGCKYIHNGEVKSIRRKSALTELMSCICDKAYGRTPVINNEAVNRHTLTTTAYNSRSKIIAALLRPDLEHHLGLLGSGQEVSIMRSTLVRTGILEQEENQPATLNLTPNNEAVAYMLGVIERFLLRSKQVDKLCFEELYQELTLPAGQIGLRKGLIPIYIAVVLHQYRQEIILSDNYTQVSLSVDTLLQLDAKPSGFFASFRNWSPEKERYIQSLATMFSNYVITAEKSANSYDFVANAMRRWFMALPKYAREAKQMPNGNKVERRYTRFLALLRQGGSHYEMLFEKIPAIFDFTGEFTAEVAESMREVKYFYDDFLLTVRNQLAVMLKKLFILDKAQSQNSMRSLLVDWMETLDEGIFEQLFSDGTDKCLKLFQSTMGDEDSLIDRLAKLLTDLRIEDWNDTTYQQFYRNLEQVKRTAEGFKAKPMQAEPSKSENDGGKMVENYTIIYADETGEAVTKRFPAVEYSKRAKLLENQINSALRSMGRSISEEEKRQVLMKILTNLC